MGLASDAAFRTRAGATRIGRLNRAVTPTGTTNHTYNKANQIADSGYVYDANGSLTSDGTHTYTYDALNRLTGVSGGGSNETYTLDGAGNRLAETVNGQTTTFGLDLRGLATVLAAGGCKYLDGAPNFGYDENGNWTSSLTDQAGSVLRSVAPDGTVSAAVRYDPFGGLRPGSATPSGFGYTGEWTDPSGLVNLRARAYDPTLGRFVSADSWGGTAAQPLSANAYAYGLDNPLAYTDPSGHIGKAINFVLSNPGLLIMMIPAIGEAYALGCAITGQDLITGQQLSTGERFLYALGAAGLVGRLGGELAGVGGRFLAAAGRSLGEGMRAFSSGEHMATELAGAERAFGEGMRAMGAGERELGGAATGADTGAEAGAERQAADAAAGDRAMSGPVEFSNHEGASPEQMAQYQRYVEVGNEARDAGALSRTGRVSTNGGLGQAATRAARVERLAGARAGSPYVGVVGHGPDTTWTGNPVAFKWLDLDPKVNSSLAGQVNRYSVGYRPTEFRFVPR